MSQSNQVMNLKAAYNRTIVELKLKKSPLFEILTKTYNRTIVELK